MGKEIYVVDIESDCTDKISDDLEKVNRHIDKLGRSIDRLREQLKRFDMTQFRMEIGLKDQSVNSFVKITCKEDGIFRLSINLDTEVEGLNIDLPLEDVIKSITELKESLSNLPSYLTAVNWKDDSAPTKFNGLKRYARGGFLNSPHIGIVGEEGPEAIIPLSASRRERGKQLWYETGMRLGTLQGMSSGNYNGETGYVDLKRTLFGNLSVINSVAKYANGTIYAGNDISNNGDIKTEDWEDIVEEFVKTFNKINSLINGNDSITPLDITSHFLAFASAGNDLDLNFLKKGLTLIEEMPDELVTKAIVKGYIEDLREIGALEASSGFFNKLGNWLSVFQAVASYAVAKDEFKDITMWSGTGSVIGGMVGSALGAATGGPIGSYAGGYIGSFLGEMIFEGAYDIISGNKSERDALKKIEETSQYIDSNNIKAEIHLGKQKAYGGKYPIDNKDLVNTVQQYQKLIPNALGSTSETYTMYNKHNQMVNVEDLFAIAPAIDTYFKLLDIEKTALAEFEGEGRTYRNSNALKYVEKIKETLKDYGKDAPDALREIDMFKKYKIFFEEMYSDIEEDESDGKRKFRRSIVENPKNGFENFINPIRSKIAEDIGSSITGLQNSSMLKTYVERLTTALELYYQLCTDTPLREDWETSDLTYEQGSISNVFGDLSYDRLDDEHKKMYVYAFIVSFLRNKFGLDEIKDEDGNRKYWDDWQYFFGNIVSDSDKLKKLSSIYESTYSQSDLDVKAHANGGIFTSTHMGIVAESGPEAIIPLSGSNKHRGVELWYQTGKALGFGLTDIASPYNYDNVRERDSLNKAMPQRSSVENSGGNGGKQSKSNVEINIGGIGGMNFTINTSGSDKVIQDIREEIPEVANELADTIANALARAYSNMPLNYY